MQKPTKSGYVAISGKPNVGKSTLLNSILGQKLSITSRKPQTTRHNILGIKTEDNVQVIYVDTPGIHSKIKNVMNRYMNQAARSAVLGVDLILFVTGGVNWQEEDENILKFLQTQGVPIFLLINKIDLIADKEKLLLFVDRIRQQADFAQILYISALRSQEVGKLETLIKDYLPATPHVFAEDEITDKNAKFIVAERVREKLTRKLGAELPYAITVQVAAFEEEDKIIKILAIIFVERNNQKAIVIGKDGSMLKNVGQAARQELEDIMGKKILLKLWVKVRSGWADDKRLLNSLGYQSE